MAEAQSYLVPCPLHPLTLQPRLCASALCRWVILNPLLLAVFPECFLSGIPDNQGLRSLGLLVETWVGAGQALAKEKCRSFSHRPHPVPLSPASSSLGSFRP